MSSLDRIPEEVEGDEEVVSSLVDFTNAWKRAALETGNYLTWHEKTLKLCADDMIPVWAAESARREAADAAAKGCEERPLAFVFDLDEVLLSNVACQGACRAGLGVFYPADHFYVADRPWPRRERFSPALPGARELLAAAAEFGDVAIVTGRAESLRDETVDNLVAVGLATPDGAEARSAADIGLPPLDEGTPVLDAALMRAGPPLIMCPDGRLPRAGESIEPFKRAARVSISRTHRICAIFGDQVSDMGVEGDVSMVVHNPFYFTL